MIIQTQYPLAKLSTNNSKIGFIILGIAVISCLSIGVYLLNKKQNSPIEYSEANN